MSSVGETLRRERLRAGLDLDKIARDTKISVRTLELIEANHFEKLPGGVFTRSFVRQYAHAVGLDADEIVAELEKWLAPPDPFPALQEATKQPEIRMPRVERWSGAGSRLRSNSSLPALALVVLVIIACSTAYTWFQKSRRTPTPSEIAETAQPAGVPEATSPAPAPAQAPSVEKAPAASATPVVATAAPLADPPTGQTVSGTVTTDASTGALRIALTAEEATWVRATANGKVVFSGIIQANETKALSAPDTVTLRIGNAGGVAITLNGKTIPAVGPKGQVRVVQLSPDGGVQVAPPPKPQPTQPPAQQTQTL